MHYWLCLLWGRMASCGGLPTRLFATSRAAASLGEPSLAVDALLMKTPKNTWRANGHNWQRPNLPLYLLGNGGLLLAIAHMAGKRAFPESRKVRWEGLPSIPLY
jgi:hypothetical protein